MKNLVLKTVLPLAFIMLSTLLTKAQTDCQNVDFEYGDFTNWQAYTGYNPGAGIPAPVNTPGIVSGRHTIMNVPGTDPYSNGTLPLISPYGGSYSVRLGNDEVNSEAERLSKTILITPQNTSLVYEYAVVFEDPGHDPSEQPRFELNILDQTGTPINNPCYNYSVTAASNLTGYHQGPNDIVYRVWTPVALDLSAYVGQNITIEFTTYDCSLGGHFGYAYFDARCTKLEIIKSNCDSNQVIISVPPGFISYVWSTGDTTQSLVLDNPPIGAEYSVTATSETGCNTTLSLIITNDNPPPPSLVIFPAFCPDGSAVTLTAPVGFNKFLWSNGDTTNITSITGPALGDTVSVQLSNGIYCPTVVSYIFDSIPSGATDITTEYISVCLNADSALAIGPPGYSAYSWSTGQTTPNIIIHNPHVNDTLTLQITPAEGCPKYYQYIIDNIINGGQSTYVQNQICQGAQSVLLSPGENYLSYQWSTGQTTSYLNVSQPQIGDTIKVSYVEYNGCFGSIYYVFEEVQSQNDTTYNTVSTCLWTPTYNLTAPGGFINYAWSTGTTGNHVSIHYPQQGQQLYVQMLSNNGCKSYVGYTFNLINNFPPNNTITFGQFCQTTKELELSAPAGYQAYIWSTGSYGQTTSVSNPQGGDVYNVILIDNNGCRDTIDISLSYNNLPANMTIDKEADVFTPNGDGINDDYGIVSENYQFYELTIYNRWGNVVFTSDSDTKRWNGITNGVSQPTGGYYYIFRIKACGIDKLITHKGVVNLLRD